MKPAARQTESTPEAFLKLLVASEEANRERHGRSAKAMVDRVASAINRRVDLIVILSERLDGPGYEVHPVRWFDEAYIAAHPERVVRYEAFHVPHWDQAEWIARTFRGDYDPAQRA